MVDGAKTTSPKRNPKTRLQSAVDGNGIQDEPRRVPKKGPRKSVSSKKVEPEIKIGDRLPRSHAQWTPDAKVISIGEAVVVYRDSKGFTFTKMKPGYEFPES